MLEFFTFLSYETNVLNIGGSDPFGQNECWGK
jgi:hypothetical protein